MNRADLNVHIVWRSTPLSVSRYGCVHPPRSSNTKNNKSNPLSVADHTTPLCNRHSLPTHSFIWSSVMMRSESVLKAQTRPHWSRTSLTGPQMHFTLIPNKTQSVLSHAVHRYDKASYWKKCGGISKSICCIRHTDSVIRRTSMHWQ